MIAEELMNQMIPALTCSDTVEKALIWMEELKTSQLPVIDNGRFKGLISEETILEENNLDEKVSFFRFTGENSYVYYNQHFFDIVRVAKENNATLVAILDRDKTFMGVSSLNDTFDAFASTSTIQSEGGILILSMRYNDYSLSEISRLIEADNAKILGSCISNHSKPDHIYLTLKLNTIRISGIIATLERFNYRVEAKFHSSKEDFNEEKDRINNLFRFLDI